MPKLIDIDNQIEFAINNVNAVIDTKPEYGREIALVRTKLQEARHWLWACGIRP